MLLTRSVNEQDEGGSPEVQRANVSNVGGPLLEYTGPYYQRDMSDGATLTYPNQIDDTCCYSDPPDRGAPGVDPYETDIYGFPIGMAGTFVPETLIYPDDKNQKQGKARSGSGSGSGSGSESDSRSERKHKKHRKKKKSKHRKHKKEKKEQTEKTSQNVSPYLYYSDGSQVMIVPEEAITYRHGPSGISEEAFERHMPPPPHRMDHCVAEDYDPAWQYNLKEYIRDQQHVKGCTEPVIRERWPYESHIDEFPPVDYHMDDPYDDNGPYEHHLPAAGGRAASRDPRMINSNFIIRKREDSRRHL